MTTLFLSLTAAVLSTITLLSPDNKTQATLTLPTTPYTLHLSVTHNDVEMLSPSEIGLDMENNAQGTWRVSSKHNCTKRPFMHLCIIGLLSPLPIAR